jgi:tetratricopeptide (TPR) repeat protein
MHYFIILTIIVGIVIWQLWSFFSNKKKLSSFENIFPDIQSKFELVQDVTTNDVLEIKTSHKNYILDVIISSLNIYLINNKGAVSDFHLMKDIVDRNCDAKEEEIQTQIPVPLYLGLTGTMLGILIGVGFLVFGGGLNELLDSNNSSGVEDIETLLGGVALAMISSILGILLTTFGSYISRNAKVNIEKNKNTFLSWIQEKLLPNMSTDTSSALVRMTENLSNFNSAFAGNTEDLRGTLSKVNDSYRIQADLIQAINRLRIEDIASANIEVYDKLKNSTNEVGVFAQYLEKSNEYLGEIQRLNQKLDEYEKRTQIIENAGNFFNKNERWLAENFDTANLEVKAAIERFNKNIGESLTKLKESFNEQILNLDDVIQRQQEKLQETLIITTEIIIESYTKTQQSFEEAILYQQSSFKEKLHETSKLVEELKNLTHIKEGIKDFKIATNTQNKKIDELTKEIRALAKAKIEGGTIKQEIIVSKWIKILIISGSSLLAISCLFFILPLIIDWITNLFNWLF